MTGSARSSRARAIASWSLSPGRRMPWRALAAAAPQLAPIRLRIGVHTGEVRLRDEGSDVGPALNRAARLRELAHGGQTCYPVHPTSWSSTTSQPMRG